MKKNSEEKMHIGIRQMAELLGISQSALRYYESENLITSIRDESSNYRDYSFLTMIELTDIILYRKLGIPVKQLPKVMNATSEESLQMIEDAIDTTEDSIEEMLNNLRTLRRKRRNISIYERMKLGGAKIVSTTALTKVSKFPMMDEEQMRNYLRYPQSSVVFFPDATETEVFTDGIQMEEDMLSLVEFQNKEIIWEQDADAKKRYYECLLKADYAFTQNNNLDEIINSMKELGLTPGCAVGRYLMAAYDETEGKKYDYYQLWIEIK